MRIVVAVALIGLAVGCEKRRRNQECFDFSAWANDSGKALSDATSEEERRAATTHEQQAALYRKLAAGARQAAKGEVPFKDPYVKDLATRQLRWFDIIAVALDHRREGWEKHDSEAIAKAIDEEMRAKGEQGKIADEWMKSCRL